MMGHGDADFDNACNERRMIVHNDALLTPKLLGEVNGLVVAAGQEVAKRKLGDSLAARC